MKANPLIIKKFCNLLEVNATSPLMLMNVEQNQTKTSCTALGNIQELPRFLSGYCVTTMKLVCFNQLELI